jgi:hypothetical protein
MIIDLTIVVPTLEECIEQNIPYNKTDEYGFKQGIWFEETKINNTVDIVYESVGYYKEGLRHGFFKFSINGKVAARGHFLNDKKNGFWFFGDEKYNVSGVFVDDYKTGVWTTQTGSHTLKHDYEIKEFCNFFV